MTADEFYEWANQPENDSRWFELVRGEVIEVPPPQRPHGAVCSLAAWILGGHARQRRKGYVTCNSSGVILERDPDTVRGVDVAYYEDAVAFADLNPRYGDVPPRLAIDVLSPNGRADQVLRRITDYLVNGVELVWLVDPVSRTVMVFRPDRTPRVFEEHEELTGEDVFPGLRCPVMDLFRPPWERSEAVAKPPRKRRRK